MPYEIEGETLLMREVIARCSHDTAGRPLSRSTVQKRLVQYRHRTWRQLRATPASGAKRAADKWRHSLVIKGSIVYAARR